MGIRDVRNGSEKFTGTVLLNGGPKDGERLPWEHCSISGDPQLGDAMVQCSFPHRMQLSHDLPEGSEPAHRDVQYVLMKAHPELALAEYAFLGYCE